MQLKATPKQGRKMAEVIPDYARYCQHWKGFADISVLAGCVMRAKGILVDAEVLV